MKKLLKEKNKTKSTNYQMDSHKEFCKRCFSYNNGCPDNQGGKPNKQCSL